MGATHCAKVLERAQGGDADALGTGTAVWVEETGR
jgi:hypothetical protein